jgi:hypothetical protein
MSDLIREQVETNYKAFQEKLPSIRESHRGKFALMKDGEIIEFFDTARDAYAAGQKIFEDRIFSIQEVIEKSIDLGFFSHALRECPV